MLLFYLGFVSLALVILAPILVVQNMKQDNQFLEPVGSCRLKPGFMIDCFPDIPDSLIGEKLCATRSCCFKYINKDKEAPVCHRRLPSPRSFSVSSSNTLIPSMGNNEDIDNPPISETIAYKIASHLDGHVVIKLCAETEKGYCVKDNNELPNVDDSNLSVNILSDKYQLKIKVSRQDDLNTTLFDSSNGATIIGTKMSEISTLLSSPYIYGLGGHPASFNPKLVSNFTLKSLFGTNLIDFPQRTSIKSFVSIDEQKNFYGVVMESQTPAEIELLPGLEQRNPLLVFRSMGGEMSFHIFRGPKPSDVMRQMNHVFGHPKIPPKWVLGIHLCRKNSEIMNGDSIVKGLPYDSDCLDRELLKSGFSLEYSSKEIKDKVKLLQDENKKFVLTNPLPVDVKSSKVNKLKFIRDRRSGEKLVGDYLRLKNVSIPDVVEDSNAWNDALKDLFGNILIPDALHISDNAPDVKINGKDECDIFFSHKELRSKFHKNLCHLYHFGTHSAENKSHSNIRDSYPGLIIEKSSTESMKNVFSDFASLGIQKHGWILSSGFESEDHDEWDLLRNDLKTTLEYGLSGVPIRSTNPCTRDDKGQIKDEDACYRWFCMGAFMPALNTLRVSPDDLESGKYRKWIKRSIGYRYKLHPYYYTTIASKNLPEGPLIRPMFYEFPWDPETYDISYNQVMIGDGLLLAPVTNKYAHDTKMVSIYFPQGTWYDLWSGAITRGQESYLQVTCFDFSMPMFLRRGKIIPIFEDADHSVDSTYASQNYSLIVGLDCDITPAKANKVIKECSASGFLYLEEGKDLIFNAKRTEKGGEIRISPPKSKWSRCGSAKSLINSFFLYGIEDVTTELTLPNGNTISVDTDDINGQAYFNKDYNRLDAKNLNLDFCQDSKELIISWKFSK